LATLSDKKTAVAKKFFGGTGTALYGGYLSEDYLEELNGPDRADVYERMRRGDGQVQKILGVIKGPIKGARFEFEPSGDTEKHKKAAEFTKWNWLNNPFIDFDLFVNEQLTNLDFGCAVHEYIHTYHEHKEFGKVHILGGLGFRKQSTIYEWIVKGSSGLIEIHQIVDGDTIDPETYSAIIPADRLLVNVNNQEGDNFEGISLLRGAYGSWFRKNTYLKLIAIGMEKAAIGTPVGSYPNGVEGKGELEEFKLTLGNLATNEQNYVVKPKDYEIEIVSNTFEAEKMLKNVEYEDAQIAGAALVSFLELGKSGGAYALSNDLSDIALLATRFVGDSIARIMCKPTRELCAMNFGDPELAPHIHVVGIDKKAGKEFAEVITSFIDSGAIRVDNTLESFIRKSADLPEAEKPREEGEANPPTPGGPNPPTTKPATNKPLKPGEEKPTEADRDEGEEGKDPKESEEAGSSQPKAGEFEEGFSPFRALTEFEAPLNYIELIDEFDSEERKLKNLMTTKLTLLSEHVLKDFKNRLKNRKGDRIAVAEKTNVDVSGYAKSLELEFARQVSTGVESAKRDLQAKVKMFGKDEKIDAQLEADFADDDKIKKDLKVLPKAQQAATKAQAREQAKVHKADIERIILFGTVNAETNELNDAQLVRQLETEVDEMVKGRKIASAAATITTQNLNKARAALFTDPGVADMIQALQYSAVLDSSTTPICRSLDGEIFDPKVAANFVYTPPNHHGCRSILVPITVFESKPKISKLKPNPNNPSMKKGKDGKPLSVNDIMKTKNLEDPENETHFL
jgi:SPP1 gp7 family putative phage head morphogenesis protein